MLVVIREACNLLQLLSSFDKGQVLVTHFGSPDSCLGASKPAQGLYLEPAHNQRNRNNSFLIEMSPYRINDGCHMIL